MKFLASRELGRLARWLRILGFDALYFRENNKSSLIITALRDNRIVLTRNNVILQDKALHSICIQSEDLKKQLTQVIRELSLSINKDKMFTRCILCNELLSDIPKQEVESFVPRYVFETQEKFLRCNKCGRIYWQGTHWGNVKDIMETICN